MKWNDQINSGTLKPATELSQKAKNKSRNKHETILFFTSICAAWKEETILSKCGTGIEQ